MIRRLWQPRRMSDVSKVPTIQLDRAWYQSCRVGPHFPYDLQAGAAGVDILLQPSWTWGSLGPRHMAGNALRAVENGFTLFRCSSVGLSGVVLPRGQAAGQMVTGSRDLLTFQLPVRTHVRTLYLLGGEQLHHTPRACPAARLAHCVRWLQALCWLSLNSTRPRGLYK